jgi:hypothetical protein
MAIYRQRIAKQTTGIYEHHNPASGSWVTTTAWNRCLIRQERDPDGGQIPVTAPPSRNYVSNNFGSPLFIEGGDPSDYSGGHEIDGLPVSDSEFARRTGDGSGAITVSVQGRDGKWQQGGPLTKFFPGQLGTSVWVDTSQYIHPNHNDNPDVDVSVFTDLQETGYWKNVASGFRLGGRANPFSLKLDALLHAVHSHAVDSGYSRLTEVEAWGNAPTPSSALSNCVNSHGTCKAPCELSNQ